MSDFSGHLLWGSQLRMVGAQAALNDELTPAYLVAARPGRARVFEHYGLDYGQLDYGQEAGACTLRAWCAERGLAPQHVLAELHLSDEDACAPFTDGVAGRDWQREPLMELAAHVVETHHGLLRAEVARLSHLVGRVTERYGSIFHELWDVQGLFEDAKEQLELLLAHEGALFPLQACAHTHSETLTWHSQGLHAQGLRELGLLREEHKGVRASLDKITAWTRDFRPLVGVCLTYRVVLDGLHDLNIVWAHHSHETADIFFARCGRVEALTTRLG